MVRRRKVARRCLPPPTGINWWTDEAARGGAAACCSCSSSKKPPFARPAPHSLFTSAPASHASVRVGRRAPVKKIAHFSSSLLAGGGDCPAAQNRLCPKRFCESADHHPPPPPSPTPPAALLTPLRQNVSSTLTAAGPPLPHQQLSLTDPNNSARLFSEAPFISEAMFHHNTKYCPPILLHASRVISRFEQAPAGIGDEFDQRLFIVVLALSLALARDCWNLR